MARRVPAQALPGRRSGWRGAGLCLAGAALLATVSLAPAWLPSAVQLTFASRVRPTWAAWRPQFRRPRVVVGAFDVGGALQGLLGDDDEEYEFEVPTTAETVVNGLKESTENTLNQGISRLDVECPPGFVFGVEGGGKGKLTEADTDSKNAVQMRKSNRELARIFVEMLQPIGEGLVVAFGSGKEATNAKKKWKLTKDEVRVISFPDTSKSSFASEVGAPSQFIRQLRRSDCQCLLVVAPRLAELKIVAELSNEVQNQMGIVLLNARIHGNDKNQAKLPTKLLRELQDTFPPTYHLRFLKQRKNAVLFQMNGPEGLEVPWILSQQRQIIGKGCVADEVARFSSEPLPEEVERAFEVFDQKEKGLGDKFIDMLEKK